MADGCEDDCCRKVMENAGTPVDLFVRIKDPGIGKQLAEFGLITETKRTVDRVHSQLDS